MDRSIDGPKNFINSNIIGTFNILEILRKQKIANVDWYMNDKLTHQYKDITIEHANNLWTTAIKTGYEVAF